MRHMTPEQSYITNYLLSEKVNRNTSDFYHELIELFNVTDQLVSTSKKLAEKFGRHERSIQRYVKTLKDNNLIHVRPHYNNKNPDKTYIEYSVYTQTYISEELQERAKNYCIRDHNVHFAPGVF